MRDIGSEIFPNHFLEESLPVLDSSDTCRSQGAWTVLQITWHSLYCWVTFVTKDALLSDCR